MAVRDRKVKATGPRVTGVQIVGDITKLKPNPWNPNRMTEFERESLGHGLTTRGWLASQGITVWGKDEKGKVRNLIIDGEQRWTVGIALGFTKAPMVVLDGITMNEAKSITIELDNKRGKFDPNALADVVRSIIATHDDRVDVGMQLGFTAQQIDALLKPVLPPSEFRTVGMDVKTDYCCPKCGYEWSGSGGKSKNGKGDGAEHAAAEAG